MKTKYRVSVLTAIVSAAILAAPARADNFYVSTEARDVDKITSAGAVSVFASELPFPAGAYPDGLAFDSSGNLYATDPNKKQINKITPDGTLSLFKTLPTNSFPGGLTIDASGNLFVPNVNGVQIAKITPTGTLTVFASMAAGSDCEGLAFDGIGNLYVVDSNNNQIDKITLAGTVSLFASLPSDAFPEGLAFDGIGNLYETGLDNKVRKITPGGAVSLFATLPNSADPEAVGLAFDSSGSLYAAGLSGQISKITPDGTVSYFATANYAALFIAVTDDAGHPLAVPPVTLLGDYNRNGSVDAADYIVWRKGLGSIYNQADYQIWRGHFGESIGVGSGTIEANAIPEPSCTSLLLAAVITGGVFRIRAHRISRTRT
jgi:sugar lactone lactonase YvrE